MDLQAFKQRVLPVQGRLFRLAQLFLRNREEAEDALQDVLLRLWSNRQQLDAHHSVEALAVQITKNLCLDRLKTSRRHPISDTADYQNVLANEASPYHQLELIDSARLMQRLIDSLPDQQKLIIHLREVDECSFEEIEQLTRLTINNIRVILSRTRQRLRDDYLKVNNHETNY